METEEIKIQGKKVLTLKTKILTSNIWSRKGIPVELSATPVPSKLSFTETFVSFVTLFTSPIRAD